MWDLGYKEPTVKLYMDFRLCRGLCSYPPPCCSRVNCIDTYIRTYVHTYINNLPISIYINAISYIGYPIDSACLRTLVNTEFLQCVSSHGKCSVTVP